MSAKRFGMPDLLHCTPPGPPGESQLGLRAMSDTSESLQINPVSIYRLWNTYYDYYTEGEHAHVPWLLVKPFLERHGYNLLTRGDLKKRPNFDYDPRIAKRGSPTSLLFDTNLDNLRFCEPRGFVSAFTSRLCTCSRCTSQYTPTRHLTLRASFASSRPFRPLVRRLISGGF